MSKIKVQNQQLPVSATVKYTRDDNGHTVSQTVQKKSTITTAHSLRTDTNVTVSASGNSKSIMYEDGCDTLVILQEGAQNNFELNWI